MVVLRHFGGSNGAMEKNIMCLMRKFCGLEALVENNQMVRVRPDKENPRSQGYACRKGLNIKHHQHHADRLRYPLKKVEIHSKEYRGIKLLMRSQSNSVPLWTGMDRAPLH